MEWKSHLAVAFVSVMILVCSLMAHSQVSFFQPPTFAGSGGNFFVADFNGDGQPDILSGDGTMNLGNGDGTFTQGTAVTGGALAVADFNGDGKPDVLQQGTGTLLVLLGKGDGTFQAPISSPSNANLLLPAATDLNGDGKADAIGIFNNALLVYIGKGNGMFASGVSYDLGSSSEVAAALSFGDFNGDGTTDIAVTMSGSLGAGLELVWLSNGDGTLQAAKSSVSINVPKYAAVGDFNGDRKLDLAISNDPSSCGSFGGCGVSILLGNGDGTLQMPTAVIVPSGDVSGGGPERRWQGGPDFPG